MAKSFLEDFKWARRIKLLNKILTIGCIIFTVIGINIFSMRHFYRFDRQRGHNFALEKFSLDVVTSLEDPVEIFLFYGHNSSDDSIPFFVNDLRNLLKEYCHVAPDRIRVKFIDVVQQPRVAEELALKFGTMTTNGVIIASGGNFRVIPAFDFYEFKDGIASGFCGERIISNELFKFSKKEAKKVFFSTGHGEIDCGSVHPLYGSSVARELLRQRGYVVEKIKLAEYIFEKDAKLLIIAGAQTNFTESEIQVLRTFLRRGGNVLILLSPPKLCGFEDFFFDWGILADDMLIMNENGEHLGLSGDNIIDHFAEHKITKPLLDMQLAAFLGLCQPVRRDIGSTVEHRRITSLLFSGEKTFAKLDYLQSKPKYNSTEDLMGPVPIATLSEEIVDEGTGHGGGKLLVVGSANFITNNRFCVLGNKVLWNAMVTWLMDDDNLNSDSIGTRMMESYKITLSKTEFMNIGKMLLFIPLLLLLIGWIIGHMRRNFR
ncbi:MAG: GldG family protein [Puniceicoccales bacterium]|jgi:hypothetical protein|nr:GldG family protein [Puniceicoccales bacterium]